VATFLAENNIETLEWPPQSPDLSPIEHIWNVMKMKMKALNPRPRGHAQMRDRCGEIWLTPTDDVGVGLLQPFRERLRKCLKAKGDMYY
jgi:hypothetical protein